MSESLAITARVSRDLYELVRMTKQQIVDCNLSFSKSFRFPKCLIYCSDWIFRPHRGFSGSCQTIRYAQGEQILGWKLSPVVLYRWLTLRNTTWLSFQPNSTHWYRPELFVLLIDVFFQFHLRSSMKTLVRNWDPTKLVKFVLKVLTPWENIWPIHR